VYIDFFFYSFYLQPQHLELEYAIRRIFVSLKKKYIDCFYFIFTSSRSTWNWNEPYIEPVDVARGVPVYVLMCILYTYTHILYIYIHIYIIYIYVYTHIYKYYT